MVDPPADEDLTVAMARDEIEAFLQPVVHLGSERLAGFEALARWRHRRDGVRLPHTFFPAAEAAGAASVLGWRIVRHTCEFIDDWRRVRGTATWASVNLSAAQLGDPDAARVIEWALDDHHISPAALRLEVAESSLVDVDGAGPLVRALQATGCSLIVDDFGSGTMTVEDVLELGVDHVKLDRSLLARLGDGATGAHEVERVVAALVDNGVTVCAKGIERRDDATRLFELGCSLGQGYLFSIPVPRDEALRSSSADGA